MPLRAQRGNLVAVAMMVPRHVLNLNEIATWFDRLTMSGCAPRNDNRKTLLIGAVDGIYTAGPLI
jgi:hypothetical protein